MSEVCSGDKSENVTVGERWDGVPLAIIGKVAVTWHDITGLSGWFVME